jgi:hypothetical protein
MYAAVCSITASARTKTTRNAPPTRRATSASAWPFGLIQSATLWGRPRRGHLVMRRREGAFDDEVVHSRQDSR